MSNTAYFGIDSYQLDGLKRTPNLGAKLCALSFNLNPNNPYNLPGIFAKAAQHAVHEEEEALIEFLGFTTIEEPRTELILLNPKRVLLAVNMDDPHLLNTTSDLNTELSRAMHALLKAVATHHTRGTNAISALFLDANRVYSYPDLMIHTLDDQMLGSLRAYNNSDEPLGFAFDGARLTLKARHLSENDLDHLKYNHMRLDCL